MCGRVGALRPCAQGQVGVKAQLWPPGHHDARVPKETLWRQQNPHHPGCALPVHLHLHQDLGKAGTPPGRPPLAAREQHPSGRVGRPTPRTAASRRPLGGGRGRAQREAGEEAAGGLAHSCHSFLGSISGCRVTEWGSESPASPGAGRLSASWDRVVISC